MKKETTNNRKKTICAGSAGEGPGMRCTVSSPCLGTPNPIQREVRTAMEPFCRKREQAGSSQRGTFCLAFLAGLLILRLAFPAGALADTAGPDSPSSASNNSSIGTRSWSNTGNIRSADNQDASVSLSNNQISNYLVATGFGFSVPAGATISGISVSIERADGNRSSSASIRDNSIRIVKGGTITGTDQANTGSNWPTSDQSASYGSSADLWGETWTAADINASNFGVALSARGVSSSSYYTENALVDAVRITVYYTSAASCTPNAATLLVSPAAQSTAPGGSASYAITVTNNDSIECAPTAFTLNVLDSNSANFTTPSSLTLSTLTLGPGQTGTSTVTVTANSAAPDLAVNTTTIGLSAAGHGSPPDVSVITTVAAPAKPPVRSLLHNSNSTGSAKWSAEGGWGVAGGKYGEFTCETCHTSGAPNIKNIRQSLTAPDASKGNFPGSTVALSRVSGTAALYAAGQGLFGDDTSCSNPAYTDQASCTANGGTWSARSQSDRICEACHSATSYHRYNTGDPDGTGPLTAQNSFGHNNASDCLKCHPHNQGFRGSGDCYMCHTGDQNATRRSVVNDTAGGDFRKASHHVTNGTTDQIANKDVCMVCHGDVLADKGHPGIHPADPGVDLKDPDTGEYVSADEAGIELVCARCHDANGATRAGLPAGATAMQPFNLASMTVKDTGTPPDIGWVPAGQAHSYNAANGAGGCLACHGNAAASGSTLDPKKNGHGSDQYRMMQFPYSTAVAAYSVSNQNNFCYNCHGSTAANGAVNAVKTQIDSIGAAGGGHETTTCYDCHNPHQAKAGNHANGTTLAGVLTGVAGKSATWSAASVWPSTSNAAYAPVDPASAEWQICFKCHAGTGFAAGGTGAAGFTDLGMEYNPNNKSRHSVGSALASGDRLAAAQFTGGRCSLPEYSSQTECTAAGGTWTAWAPGAVMTCTDCHATDVSGQNGPHGSSVKWMLSGVNKSWPYQGTTGNGGSAGTYWTLSNMATNKGTANGLFCFNCHTLNASNHIHFDKSDHTRIPCVGCHVRVPHGYSQSRLIAADSGNTLPARYYQDGNGGGTKYIRSFTKASSYSSYSKSNCTTVSGCH